jgi:hypothetical protein
VNSNAITPRLDITFFPGKFLHFFSTSSSFEASLSNVEKNRSAEEANFFAKIQEAFAAIDDRTCCPLEAGQNLLSRPRENRKLRTKKPFSRKNSETRFRRSELVRVPGVQEFERAELLRDQSARARPVGKRFLVVGNFPGRSFIRAGRSHRDRQNNPVRLHLRGHRSGRKLRKIFRLQDNPEEEATPDQGNRSGRSSTGKLHPD